MITKIVSEEFKPIVAEALLREARAERVGCPISEVLLLEYPTIDGMRSKVQAQCPGQELIDEEEEWSTYNRRDRQRRRSLGPKSTLNRILRHQGGN